MKRAIAFLFLVAVALFSQSGGQPVNIVQFPNETPSRFMDYAGGSNLTYLCLADPINHTNEPSNYSYSLSVAGSTLTSIVVSSNVGTVTTVAAHGLQVNQPVAVSGSTTTALNGNYSIASIVSTTVFTITTSGVGNATYNNSALTISGTVPLLTSPIWSIAHFNYDGSSNLIGTQCANGTCQVRNQICANRTTLNYW